MADGMRPCPNCGKPNPAGAAKCGGCRLQLEGGPKAEWTSFMPVVQIGAVVLVLGLVGLGWKLWPLPKVPDVLLQSWSATPVAEGSPRPAGVDPCAGRERCVLLYLAPWASECKQLAAKSVPDYRVQWRLPERADRPGLKVIIGGGDPASHEEMAGVVGEPVFIDYTSEFKKRMKVELFPAYFVIDPENRVLKSGPEAAAWVEAELAGHPR